MSKILRLHGFILSLYFLIVLANPTLLSAHTYNILKEEAELQRDNNLGSVEWWFYPLSILLLLSYIVTVNLISSKKGEKWGFIAYLGFFPVLALIFILYKWLI